MGRKLVIVAVLLAVVLASLSLAPQRASAAVSGSLSFYVFGDDAERAAYETLVTEFNKKYPDIKVKLVHTPGEDEFKFGDQEDAYKQRLTLDFASSTPPDVFLISYREYGIFAEKKVIEPVGPYLDKSTLIKPADFYPEALTPFTQNKLLQCLPQNVSGTVVYYNKDLFDKAKVAYPKAGWAWGDFVTTAKALTNQGDGKNIQYGLGMNVDLSRLLPFVWQNGGQVVDDQAAPTKLTLDTPEAKAAFQFFVDLRRKHGVTPDETQATAQSSESRFQNGTMGMILFSRRLTPSLRQAKFDWDVAPLPVGKQAATLLYADGYCMAKASTNKDAAWALIEYANSVDGQTILAKSGRNVPSLKSVATSPAFLDLSAKPKNSQLFLDLIPNIRSTPILNNWENIQEAVNQQIETATYDGKAIDEAIKDASDEAAKSFKQ